MSVIENYGHLSLSNVLFDANVGPEKPAGAASGDTIDALIRMHNGALRLEHCTFNNPHRFAVALTAQDAGDVYAVPKMTVQVRI